MKIMMDEEMMMVAGGDLTEVMEDSIALYNAGYMGEKFDSRIYLITHWDYCSSAVDEGWKRAGVTSVTASFDCNTYFLDGQKIHRAEAYQHAGMPY